MSKLSDKEIAQAAAEAGISPGELKEALAHRESGDLPAHEGRARGTKSHGAVQATYAMQPSQALARAHGLFRQQVHLESTRDKDGQISYVSQEAGVAYRLTSEPAPAQPGALVRVDIDVSRRSKRVLKSIIPLTALVAVLSLAVGGAMNYLFFAAYVVFFFVVWSSNKRQGVKAAKETAQAALDRLGQGVLPER